MKTEHCCDVMDTNINDERVQIFYSLIDRLYYVNVMNGKRVAAAQGFIYCPWCAKKLPKNLCKEYCEILEKDYGIKWYDVDESELPQEFQTDEWWKKRGL